MKRKTISGMLLIACGVAILFILHSVLKETGWMLDIIGSGCLLLGGIVVIFNKKLQSN